MECSADTSGWKVLSPAMNHICRECDALKREGKQSTPRVRGSSLPASQKSRRVRCSIDLVFGECDAETPTREKAKPACAEPHCV